MAYQFKVGDKGKTRSGDDYEVRAINSKATWTGVPQPIRARVDGVERSFTREGWYLGSEGSPHDLMPPEEREMPGPCKFKLGDKGKTRGGWDYEIVVDDDSDTPFRCKHRHPDGTDDIHWHLPNGKSNIKRSDYDLLPPTKPTPDHKESEMIVEKNLQEEAAEKLKADKPGRDVATPIAAQMTELLAGLAREAVSEQRVRAMVSEIIAEQPPRVVEVRTPVATKKIEEHRHPMFEKVLRLAASGLNVLLVGPAGCGKTHLAGQVARALDRPFASISLTSGASESQLTGRLLPTGDAGKFEYHESPFVTMYETGGVFLLDELDAADPNMLLVINTALANGHFTVESRSNNPDVIRNENTIIIGAANTYGTGADAQYVGRQQLDAATLDRWYVVEMGYDTALECDMAGMKKKSPAGWAPAADVKAEEIREIGGWVLGLRAKIEKSKLRRTASTRMLDKAIKARQAGVPFEEIKKDLLAGWSRDELAKVQ